MKFNYFLLFILVTFVSCSDDDTDTNDNNPPENITYTEPQDLYGTQWFYDKTVYEVDSGEEIEVQPEICKARSWFEISSNLNSASHNFMNDGNNNCIQDPLNDTYIFGLLEEGFCSILYVDFTNSWQERRFYEVLLENNGIDEEPHPNNVMIWVEHETDELYMGQSLNSKKAYFKRR